MGRQVLRAMAAVWALSWASGVVIGGASWSAHAPVVDIAGHFTGAGQSHSTSIPLTIQHDGSCTIRASAVSTGSEILATDGDSLTTSYKLTGGAALQDGDTDWVSSTAFLGNTYHLQGSGPSDTLTLWVQGTALPGRAPKADGYSAAITLTVSW